MASENQYLPEIVELSGGLDYVTPKPAAGRGTLSDCLNVEQAYRKGYGRIGGYERFDGGLSNPSLNYTNLVLMTVDMGTGPFLEGEQLYISSTTSKLITNVIGIFKETVVLDFIAYHVVLVTDYAAYLSLIPNVTVVSGSTSTESATFVSSAPYNLANAYVQTAVFNNDYFYPDNISRTAPNSLDGSNNNAITALHLFKEQLYAVVDYVAYNFTTGATEVFSGDILLGPSSAESRLVDIMVTSGTFAGGNAAGVILVAPMIGAITGAQQVDRAGAPVAALTITGVSTAYSWGAGLFRTLTTGGWEEVNSGYEFTFRDGTANGPPPTFSRGNASSTVVIATAISPPTAATDFPVLGWTYSGATLLDSIDADDADYVIYGPTTATAPAAYVQVSAFTGATAIPADSEVTGMSLKINATGITAAPERYPSLLAQPFDGTGEIGAAKSTSTLRELGGAVPVSPGDDYILGGASDTWGIDDLPAALANGFGFNIAPRRAYSTGNNTTFRINYVELTVYYSSSIQTYYFWNGVDDVTAPITNIYVDSGDWTTGDAHGFMQVASIDGATRNYITAGDAIWTGPGGTGSLIAYVESNAVYAMLPSLSALQSQLSRYQIITANFYSNADWEAIYGVSGAGQAWVYDSYYFRRIYTGIVPSLDKPRHIAFNQFSLALGYSAGSVILSVQGEPENFSGVDGAVEIGIGDSITGLLRMNGTTLGVFCRNSISGITGTNVDNYSVMVLSPSEGAIEYTVVDMGKPVYCSNKGISIFDQTASYGNFLGNRLSASVASWLLPRLQNRVIPVTFAATTATRQGATGLLFATVCRSKNQLLLFFADGVCLVMTLFGPAQDPVFTLRQYDKWTTPEDITDGVAYTRFIPLAYESAIDDSGKERIFMSHYDGGRDVQYGETVYYAYEFEDSWSFDGFPIPFSMTVNENFYGNPFDFDTLRKIRLHGTGLGYAPMRVEVTTNYSDSKNATPTSIDLSLPREPEATLASIDTPYTNIATGAWRGRSFSIRLFYDRTGTTRVSPPFTAQVLQIQHKEGKGDI